jgi:RNA polymerase sigma-70 factor (ECF subfamily)
MANPSSLGDPNEAKKRALELAVRSQSARVSLTQYFRRRVRDAAEVDDLVQEVFLRLVVRGDGEVVNHVQGYIFQTAASVLADRHRRRAVRHAADHIQLDAEVHAACDFDAEHLLLVRERLRSATAALLALPERTRAIFILRRLEGFQYAEIATRLGISVSAVEKHMLRAAQHLLANTRDEQ